MFGSKRPPKGPNCVHNDQIWKDHVHREMLNARRALPCKWEPMKANNRDIQSEATSGGTLKNRNLTSGCFYPLTTTGLIGWRADLNLECYGRHAKGKVQIERLLGRPPMSILSSCRS